MNVCNENLEKKFRNNREGYGPRENFRTVRDYVKEDKSDLERFFIQANMFDPRIE